MCIAAAWTGLVCNSPKDFTGMITLVTQYCKELEKSMTCIFLLHFCNFLPLVHSLLLPHVTHIQCAPPGRSQWQKMYQKNRTSVWNLNCKDRESYLLKQRTSSVNITAPKKSLQNSGYPFQVQNPLDYQMSTDLYREMLLFTEYCTKSLCCN